VGAGRFLVGTLEGVGQILRRLEAHVSTTAAMDGVHEEAPAQLRQYFPEETKKDGHNEAVGLAVVVEAGNLTPFLRQRKVIRALAVASTRPRDKWAAELLISVQVWMLAPRVLELLTISE